LIITTISVIIYQYLLKMEEKTYRIIFRGNVVPGRDLETAKQNLAHLYHVDVKQVESLFSGKMFVLKENISLDEAQKHMFHFEEAGVVCEIEEMPMVLENQVVEPTGPFAYKPEPEQPEPTPPQERLEQVEQPEPPEPLRPPERLEQVEPTEQSEPIEPLELHEQVVQPEPTPPQERLEQVEQPETPEPPRPPERLEQVEPTEQSEPIEPLELHEQVVQPEPTPPQERLEQVEQPETPEPPRPPERLEQVEPTEQSEPIEPLELHEQVAQPESLQPPKRLEQVEQSVPGQALEQQAPSMPTPPPIPQQDFTFRKAPRKTSSPLLLLFFIVIVVTIVIVVIKPFSTQEQITSPAVSPSEPQSREPSPSPTTPEQPAQRTTPALSSDLTESYNEPNGYYSISLPAGYKPIPKPPGDQGETEVSFMYADKAIVTISTTPKQMEWDSQQAMMQKVTAIQTGNDRLFSNYRINEYQLITIRSLRGYEILLEMGDRVAHVYELLSPTDIIFTIKIIAFGQSNLDILVSAVRENLVVY
jgi:hypothetical protein